VGLAKNKGIITSAYLAVIKKTKVKLSMDYAYLLLHSFDIDKVFYEFGGGVRQSIGFSDIKHLPILLPPIEEQHQIVNEQLKQSKKINNLILKTEKEIISIKEYREALITDLVTGKRSVNQNKMI
jgi:type I restriction enzyme S subunit